MSSTVIWILFIVFMVVLFLVVRYVGNKVVDKGADAIRNRAVRRQKEEGSGQTENLADRYRHMDNDRK